MFFSSRLAPVTPLWSSDDQTSPFYVDEKSRFQRGGERKGRQERKVAPTSPLRFSSGGFLHFTSLHRSTTSRKKGGTGTTCTISPTSTSPPLVTFAWICVRGHGRAAGMKQTATSRKTSGMDRPDVPRRPTRHSYSFSYLLLLACLLFPDVRAQSGVSFRPSRPDPTCVCDPLCEFLPEDRVHDCNLMPRGDCPCCSVCGGLEGDVCDEKVLPCDVTRRLECDPKENICKGKTKFRY